MSEHMKKPLTEQNAKVYFSWDGAHYAIPVKALQAYKTRRPSPTHHAIEEVFSDLIATSGSAGTMLKGLRAREDISQVAFSKTIGITQQNLSAIENGRRSIGKALAKKLGDYFKIDYRVFL